MRAIADEAVSAPARPHAVSASVGCGSIQGGTHRMPGEDPRSRAQTARIARPRPDTCQPQSGCSPSRSGPERGVSRICMPATRPLADESSEQRIRRIRTDRWIAYARAERRSRALEDLLTFPKRTRMPNLLLVGPTNNGKTMIVEKFRRTHPPLEAAEHADRVAAASPCSSADAAGPGRAPVLRRDPRASWDCRMT